MLSLLLYYQAAKLLLRQRSAPLPVFEQLVSNVLRIPISAKQHVLHVFGQHVLPVDFTSGKSVEFYIQDTWHLMHSSPITTGAHMV